MDRGIPSLLHSTVTVEDGGGLTLQGSTTVCPTKASTVDGSVFSMVTPPRVKLRRHEGTQGQKEGRGKKGREGRNRRWKTKEEKIERRKKSHFMLHCWYLY